MNDIQDTFKRFAGNTLMEGLVKLVTNPFFLKLLPAGEFAELKAAVSREDNDRGQGLTFRANAEAQCDELRKQFGVDGNKLVGQDTVGSIEPAVIPPLGRVMVDVDLPVFDKYNFPLRKCNDDTWTIELNDPRVREAANLATRETFRTAGALNSYEITDVIRYYLSSLDSEQVWVHNITQNKRIGLGTTATRFNEWFKETSIKLAGE
jgi:hypothetical protein